MPQPADVLLRLFSAAVEAVEPRRALERAFDRESDPPARRTWILSFGKAAHPMADAAVARLGSAGLDATGGLVIATEPGPSPGSGIEVVVGDHPLPGPGSLAAAEALENTIRNVRLGDDVLVLISGGASSLLAAPVRGISPADLEATFSAMLRSGLDIHDVNRVRKRISRWAAGRLAAALSHANVRVYAVSDVAGDDVASIGSGPCSPDSTTAVRVRAMLDVAGLIPMVPRSVIDLLDRTERGMVPETPKPGDAAFRTVETHVVASNRVAVEAAADAAVREGFRTFVRKKPIMGEAAVCGVAIAEHVLETGDAAGPWEALGTAAAPRPICWIAGGETTVTIREPAGAGGRCQEMALAAAGALAGGAKRVTILAAGTDGRDGPTDAAGALVDNDTWSRIEEAGRDPKQDLDEHDAYPALDAAGALVRTGPTGTNVADLVLAVVG
jgi:hydroxypyruvate reductase